MSEIKILRSVSDLRAQVAAWKAHGLRVGLVPTMGALHGGHLSLVDQISQKADRIIVSIFVNPTQFAAHEDLNTYPRQEADDLQALAGRAADCVYAPPASEIYPEGFATAIHMQGPALGLETDDRPHFFGGVALVVAKLFTQSQADVAIFGEKDYQQLVIIKKIIQDLNLNIKVVSVKTVRDQYGLALSSRNKLLSVKQLNIARKINHNLKKVNLYNGKASTYLISFLKKEMEKDGIINIEYLEIRSESELKKLKEFKTKDTRVFIAVNIGKIRLIDNFKWEKF